MLETVLSSYRYTFHQLYSPWQQPGNAELLNIPTPGAFNEGRWVYTWSTVTVRRCATHTHARTHPRTHTHTPTYAHVRTHTHTHTYAHTHTHTHTHTHACSQHKMWLFGSWLLATLSSTSQLASSISYTSCLKDRYTVNSSYLAFCGEPCSYILVLPF
jgi:hypothetical protein